MAKKITEKVLTKKEKAVKEEKIKTVKEPKSKKEIKPKEVKAKEPKAKLVKEKAEPKIKAKAEPKAKVITKTKVEPKAKVKATAKSKIKAAEDSIEEIPDAINVPVSGDLISDYKDSQNESDANSSEELLSEEVSSEEVSSEEVSSEEVSSEELQSEEAIEEQRHQEKLEDEEDTESDSEGTEQEQQAKTELDYEKYYQKKVQYDSEDTETVPKERLNKFIAANGIFSRRKIDDFILEGRVTVNGKEVFDLGTKINPLSDKVFIDGERVRVSDKKVYLMMNKPLNVITSVSDEKKRPTVIDILNTKIKIFPVGRLDFHTTGLLILTNDGDFTNKLMNPAFKIFKTYEVKLSRPLDQKHRLLLEKGIKLDGVYTLPAIINMPNDRDYTEAVISISQGKNRQVRRMFEHFGYLVTKLHRSGYGPLKLGNLREGEFRKLTKEEVEALLKKQREPKRDAEERDFRDGKKSFGDKGFKKDFKKFDRSDNRPDNKFDRRDKPENFSRDNRGRDNDVRDDEGRDSQRAFGSKLTNETRGGYSNDRGGRKNFGKKDFKKKFDNDRGGPKRDFGGRDDKRDSGKKDFKKKFDNDRGGPKRDFGGRDDKRDFTKKFHGDSRDNKGPRKDFVKKFDDNRGPKRDFGKKDFTKKFDSDSRGPRKDFTKKFDSDNRTDKPRSFSKDNDRGGYSNDRGPRKDFKKDFTKKFDGDSRGPRKDFDKKDFPKKFSSNERRTQQDNYTSQNRSADGRDMTKKFWKDDRNKDSKKSFGKFKPNGGNRFKK